MYKTGEGTSIVGYIAVADMTRAFDLIRSRTFDAAEIMMDYINRTSK